MSYNTELQKEVEELKEKLRCSNNLLHFYIEQYNTARLKVEELEERLRNPQTI